MSPNGSSDGASPASSRLRSYFSGIALLGVFAVAARAISLVVPFLNQLLLAVAVGFLLANVVGGARVGEVGVETHEVWLGAGIILLGATLTIDSVVESGPILLVSIVVVTAFTLLYVESLARNVFGVADTLGSLLAARSSICGVSAVVAVAGSIRAREGHVIYAVTPLVYPAGGSALALPDQVFGVWTGLSMFSTGPVVAAGFAYSETAGQWATIAKLSRNALIGLVAVGYAALYTSRQRVDAESEHRGWRARWRALWAHFRKFIIGFIVLMFAASVGVLSDARVWSIEHAYNWLFMLAFVGLGTRLRVAEFCRAGVRPVLLMLVALCTVSVSTLVVLSTVLA